MIYPTKQLVAKFPDSLCCVCRVLYIIQAYLRVMYPLSPLLPLSPLSALRSRLSALRNSVILQLGHNHTASLIFATTATVNKSDYT